MASFRDQFRPISGPPAGAIQGAVGGRPPITMPGGGPALPGGGHVGGNPVMDVLKRRIGGPPLKTGGPIVR